MKYAANIVGALVGLIFAGLAGCYFLKVFPVPEFPEGSPIAMFNGAFLSTGYMDFIKALEIVGGLLIAFPRTRNLGLLVLGPILVNIFACHIFVMQGGLLNPIIIFLTGGMAFLLWTRRVAFTALVAK